MAADAGATNVVGRKPVSANQHGKVGLGEPLWVRHHVQLCDFPVHDGDAERDRKTTVGCQDDAHRPVDQGKPGGLTAASTTSVTSGSSTASSASKSPRREAARNASTTSRCLASPVAV